MGSCVRREGLGLLADNLELDSDLLVSADNLFRAWH